MHELVLGAPNWFCGWPGIHISIIKWFFSVYQEKDAQNPNHTLLCGSHSGASPSFSHVTLHSSRAPLAFFMCVTC